MSTPLKPILTQAGLAALLNANNNGLDAMITQVALGDAAYEPSDTAIKLQSEQNRIPVSQGERIQAQQLHITAVENGDKNYWVREIGFLLDDETLLAIWSHPTDALAYKAGDIDLLLAFDLALSALPAQNIMVNGQGHLDLAPATTTKMGIVRLATDEEAQAGSLTTDAVMTPATNQVHGDNRYAQKSHRHDWQQIDNKPNTYPSAPHNHDERYVLPEGTYPNLRAQATTRADVGLSLVPNYPATNSVYDGSDKKLATAAAVKTAYDRAHTRTIAWGEIQRSPFLYYDNTTDDEIPKQFMNYTVPEGCMIVGLYSDHGMLNPTAKRWRVYYRSIYLS